LNRDVDCAVGAWIARQVPRRLPRGGCPAQGRPRYLLSGL